MQNISTLSEAFERVGWVETRRTMADAFPEGLEFRFFLEKDDRVIMKLSRFQILYLLLESKTIYDVIERDFHTILDDKFVTIWIPSYVEMNSAQIMAFMDRFRDGAVKFTLDTSTKSVVMLSSFLSTKYPVLEYIKGISHIELADVLQLVLNEDLEFDYKPILRAICEIIGVRFNRFRKTLFNTKNPFRKRIFGRQEIQYVFHLHNKLPHPCNLHYGWSKEECLYKPG